MTHLPTVLAVDDDAFTRVLLNKLFVEAGLAIETFESAQDLLDHANLGRPAVLLLDMKMPGLSGLELQSLLRKRGVALPIVFLTGSSDVAMAVEAMRNGAADFLEKPFDGLVLVERVRRSLDAFLRGAEGSATASDSAAESTARLRTLTTREREVHDWMILGKSSKEIAIELGGSFRTIETHRARVMSKMSAANLAELVRMSFYLGPAR
jgi:two-component system, LuxR family, response regulator FixJ